MRVGNRFMLAGGRFSIIETRITARQMDAFFAGVGLSHASFAFNPLIPLS
jgi:hypothetical protein